MTQCAPAGPCPLGLPILASWGLMCSLADPKTDLAQFCPGRRESRQEAPCPSQDPGFSSPQLSWLCRLFGTCCPDENPQQPSAGQGREASFRRKRWLGSWPVPSPAGLMSVFHILWSVCWNPQGRHSRCACAWAGILWGAGYQGVLPRNHMWVLPVGTAIRAGAPGTWAGVHMFLCVPVCGLGIWGSSRAI